MAGAHAESRDEAEKPFWISFADLMTALMILFLIVMVITLLSVKRQSDQLHQKEAKLAQQTEQIKKQSKQFDDFKEKDRLARERIAQQREFKQALKQELPAGVSLRGDIIEWGDQMRFDNGSSALTSEQQATLRQDIRTLLKQATGPAGSQILRRFVLEGFASSTGSYLMNLNLSLDRSQRVICALLDERPSVGEPLTRAERQQVVDLFLISGYSSNAAKRSEEASRRVELRLEFWNQKPDTEYHPSIANVGSCSIGG